MPLKRFCLINVRLKNKYNGEKMKPLISIMVPVYNVERYLVRCLDSIINQTYFNLEILLADDGSTDSSREICDRYAEVDDRIRVFHKPNEGVASTRNYLLSKATGNLLMFVDSDDCIIPDTVAIMYERLIHDGSDMVVAKHMIIDEEKGIIKFCGEKIVDTVLTSSEVLEKIEVPGFISRGPCAKLYKRELFDGLQYPPFMVGEDSWLYIHIIERCKLVSCVNCYVYSYYMIAESLTHVNSKKKWYDWISAELSVSKILIGKGHILPAQRCFDGAIRRALRANDNSAVLKIIKDSFTSDELRLLMRGRGVKPYLKWICFYVPYLYRFIRWVKMRLGFE